MMRSLFAGVSALRNHQVKMDVIGNNIANVNTIGYKAATVTFKEQLAQTLRGATAPQGGRGGTNPQQVGLGVNIAAITNRHTPGNLESTGVDSDVAIEGNGFFILSDGSEQYFTRAGAFDFDENGNLVSLAHGLTVMGYAARNGVVDVAGGLVPLRIPLNQTIPPRPTTSITVSGNLDARVNGSLTLQPSTVTLSDGAGNEVNVSIVLTPTGNYNEWTWTVEAPGGVAAGTGTVRLDADGQIVSITEDVPGSVQVGSATFNLVLPAVGDRFNLAWDDGTSQVAVSELFTPAAREQTSVRVFDSRGEQLDVIIRFTKINANEWVWTATDHVGTEVGTGTLLFDSSGRLLSQTGSITIDRRGAGADLLVIQPDFAGLNQYAEEADVTKVQQDGFPSGTLRSISIDTAGRLNGSFSNGLTQTLGQLAIADFSNPAGLLKAAGTLFQVSSNSGQPDIGLANTGSRGTIAPGSLEMSNVDLSLEFTNMIITQRGFQANSRVITASDEMLQELVNLKR